MSSQRKSSPNLIAKALGTYLKQIRKTAGLTQSDIARIGGVHLKAVNWVEQGKWRELGAESESETPMKIPLLLEAYGVDFSVNDLIDVGLRFEGKDQEVKDATQPVRERRMQLRARKEGIDTIRDAAAIRQNGGFALRVALFRPGLHVDFLQSYVKLLLNHLYPQTIPDFRTVGTFDELGNMLRSADPATRCHFVAGFANTTARSIDLDLTWIRFPGLRIRLDSVQYYNHRNEFRVYWRDLVTRSDLEPSPTVITVRHEPAEQYLRSLGYDETKGDLILVDDYNIDQLWFSYVSACREQKTKRFAIVLDEFGCRDLGVRLDKWRLRGEVDVMYKADATTPLGQPGPGQFKPNWTPQVPLHLVGNQPWSVRRHEFLQKKRALVEGKSKADAGSKKEPRPAAEAMEGTEETRDRARQMLPVFEFGIAIPRQDARLASMIEKAQTAMFAQSVPRIAKIYASHFTRLYERFGDNWWERDLGFAYPDDLPVENRDCFLKELSLRIEEYLEKRPKLDEHAAYGVTQEMIDRFVVTHLPDFTDYKTLEGRIRTVLAEVISNPSSK